MKNSFGEFLKQKRLEKNLTQKELAEILFVSSSTISKWEKDVAHPDITLLPKLSNILDVTEHELITASVDNSARQEKIQAKKWRTLSFTWSLFFYIAYAIALIPCFICNLAIDKTLSWFFIVLSALILSFTFTNLPKLIKKHKLILLPLSMYLAFCLLIGVCCIYTNGNWFFVVVTSVLLALTMIFLPIYLNKYSIFSKARKFSDFITVAVSFVLLNVLLLIVENYCNSRWFIQIALPITASVFVVLNILLCVRFLKTNKLLKTGLLLFLIKVFLFIPPLFIKVGDPLLQKEIDDFNVLLSNFAIWNENTIDNNVATIIFLTIISLSIIFLGLGLYSHIKNTRANKK